MRAVVCYLAGELGSPTHHLGDNLLESAVDWRKRKRSRLRLTAHVTYCFLLASHYGLSGRHAIDKEARTGYGSIHGIRVDSEVRAGYSARTGNVLIKRHALKERHPQDTEARMGYA